jgi:hypothetical protein
MLFDLRSRGRRRSIQVVYLFLALLIGGGLIFFGVGGGSGSTGILSQLSQNGNGGSTELQIEQKAAAKAKLATQAHPKSAAAWDAYALASYHLAVADSTSTTNGTQFDSAGATELKTLATAWAKYLTLAPQKPDVTLAADVEAIFGIHGAAQYRIAESADEVLVVEYPRNAEVWAQLTADAYYSHLFARAEIAQAKALALAPKADRVQLRTAFADIAKQTGATGSTGTTGASGAT